MAGRRNASSGKVAGCSADASTPSTSVQPLRVSEIGHYLVTADGQPFVMQADTAWWLAERSTREDVVRYLDTRREQGFNVVMVAATFDGKSVNAYGQTVWAGDASHPNPVFFEHVDFIVEQAEARGMRVALFPAWVVNVTPPDGSGLTEQNAYGYGRWIGQRYRDHSIIWVMGGDDVNWHEAIVREVARGVTNGVTGSDTDHDGVTMTYHPAGAKSSAEMFHDDAWLDFNMVQSGHCGKTTLAAGHYLTTPDFNRLPAKPIIDGEPYYEDQDWVLVADDAARIFPAPGKPLRHIFRPARLRNEKGFLSLRAALKRYRVAVGQQRGRSLGSPRSWG